MTDDSVARHASVLLAFRARNVRSFRDEMDFSMLATNLAEERAVRLVSWREGGRPLGILPVAALFGANASGKSNVLRSMSEMRAHVVGSFRYGPHGGVPRRPFMLDATSKGKPSRFEIDLVLDGVRYTYGFVFDDEQFLEEWAHRYPRGRSALLFRRRGSEVEFGSVGRAKGRAITELMRPNALFLSTAASANHPVLSRLYSWFDGNLRLADPGTRQIRQAVTTQMLKDTERGESVRAMLKAADLGISGVQEIRPDPEQTERVRRAIRVLFGQDTESDVGEEVAATVEDIPMVRLVHEASAGSVEFDDADESLGTLVWFGLVGPVIDALAKGSVLLVDELDASLHPELVGQIVRLFQDPETNPRRAQLICNTHDVTLLGGSGDRPLGRDQIWFTEKLRDGSTRLYPLSDLDPRKAEAVGRRYLAGRYGATPILSSKEFDQVGRMIASADAR